MQKGHKKFNDTIKNVLIPWCIANNRKLNNIPRCEKDSDKVHPMYSIVQRMRKFPEYVSVENVKLANKHGMIWGKCLVRKKYESKVLMNHIHNDIIPWCEENDLPISEIPALLPDGTSNPLYVVRKYLRYYKDDLPKDIVELLDEHGMDWISQKASLDDKCEKYLLSWHKKTGLPLSKMRPNHYKQKKSRTEYDFRNYIKRHKDDLLPTTVEKLDAAGMDWTIHRGKHKNISSSFEDEDSSSDGTNV